MIATVREAIASARSQPIASIVTIAMLAGMCAAVLLTAGRSVGAQQQVLAGLQSQGSLLIVVTSNDPSAGLDTDLLDRLGGVDGVAWAAGFSPAADLHNAAVLGAAPVPVRYGYGRIGDLTLSAPRLPGVQVGWATSEATTLAGFADGVGALTAGDGREVDVVRQLHLPGYLAFLQPFTVVPASTPGQVAPLHEVIIATTDPGVVAPVTDVVKSLLPNADPTKVSLQTSQQLADAQAVISGQLDDYSRQLVLGIVVVAALLVAANLFAVVSARRKDFGRRRALGASRRLIVTLLLMQVIALGIVGIAVGTGVALAVLAASGNPLPHATFVVAVAVLALGACLVGGAVPAVIASRRDPLRELRVP